MKIALICSHGGHLTELLYLIEAFNEHDIFFVTYDNIRTRNLGYRKYLFPNFGEKPYKMFLNFPKIINILLKENPDVIISNGAEIAIPFFYLGKFIGKKTIFIECYTRIDTPTITGKLVYPVSDTFLVLWPEMLEKYGKKAQYWGGMFDLENIKIFKKEENEGIFVITGMHSDFERLVKKVDEVAKQINEKFLIQLGNTKYIPKNCDYFKFKDYDEIKNIISDSKLVICQGAMTLMDAMILGTPILTVPRLKEYGEHLDNHQLIFVEKLESNGLITVLKNLEDLRSIIPTLNLETKKIKINEKLVSKINSYINSIT